MVPAQASEELYRVGDDPDNVRDLADDLRYAEVLKRHRAENERHILAVRDSVFYPEGMTGRDWAAYRDEETYPLAKLLELAGAVSDRDPRDLERFARALRSDNKCERYWGASGCVVLGAKARSLQSQLQKALQDPEPIVRLQ